MTNKKGSTIVLALVMLMALSILGATAATMAKIEMQIAGNHLEATRAFYMAESGVSYAVALLNENLGIDPEDLSVEDYTSLFQGGKVKFLITDTGIDANGKPILYVNSYGKTDGGGAAYVRARLIARFVPDLQAKSALYVEFDLENNGVAGSVEGEYAMPLCQADDIWTTEQANDTLEASNYTAELGVTDTALNDMPPIGFNAQFAFLKEYADVTIHDISNNTYLGTPMDLTQIFYHDGDVSVSNLDGYGILVIDGDLVLSGNITWNGLMYVNGNIIYNGGGHKEVYGAVLSSGSVQMNGTVNIRYQYCDLGQDLIDRLNMYEIKSLVHMVGE